MLTEIYIEAVLVHEKPADQVWDAGEIDDFVAAWAGWQFSSARLTNNFEDRRTSCACRLSRND